jgi:hypothetical protein
MLSAPTIPKPVYRRGRSRRVAGRCDRTPFVGPPSMEPVARIAGNGRAVLIGRQRHLGVDPLELIKTVVEPRRFGIGRLGLLTERALNWLSPLSSERCAEVCAAEISGCRLELNWER